MIWRVLDVAGDVLFLLDAAGLVTFVVLYGLRSRWRSSPVGRVVLGFMAAVAAIMVSAVVLSLIGDGLATYLRIVLRVALYGALLGGIVHLIVLLLRAQRSGRHRGNQDPGEFG